MLVHRAAQAARWFDVKEHWVALGLLAAIALAFLLLVWDAAEGAAIRPVSSGSPPSSRARPGSPRSSACSRRRGARSSDRQAIGYLPSRYIHSTKTETFVPPVAGAPVVIAAVHVAPRHAESTSGSSA